MAMEHGRRRGRVVGLLTHVITSGRVDSLPQMRTSAELTE